MTYVILVPEPDYFLLLTVLSSWIFTFTCTFGDPAENILGKFSKWKALIVKSEDYPSEKMKTCRSSFLQSHPSTVKYHIKLILKQDDCHLSGNNILPEKLRNGSYTFPEKAESANSYH